MISTGFFIISCPPDLKISAVCCSQLFCFKYIQLFTAGQEHNRHFFSLEAAFSITRTNSFRFDSLYFLYTISLFICSNLSTVKIMPELPYSLFGAFSSYRLNNTQPYRWEPPRSHPVPSTEHNGRWTDYMDGRADIGICIKLIESCHKPRQYIVPLKDKGPELLTVWKTHIDQDCRRISDDNKLHKFPERIHSLSTVRKSSP